MDSHLEYNKNEDLISPTQSHKRIIIVLSVFASMFCLILLFLMSMIFYTTSAAKNIYHNKQTLMTNYYFQSISKNGDVFFLPIIQSTNKSLKSGQLTKKFSLPKTYKKLEFAFVYEYLEELVYLYGFSDDEKSFVTVHDIFDRKYVQIKEFVNFTDFGDIRWNTYVLPKNVSMIEVNQFIWMYGTIILILKDLLVLE